MCTSTWRAFASVSMRSIWCFAPSTMAIQVRWWSGSRRCASPKICEMTVAASSTTLAVSHLFFAVGAAADDVGGVAHYRGHVVDGPHFRHPFAVAFLALGQAGLPEIVSTRSSE